MYFLSVISEYFLIYNLRTWNMVSVAHSDQRSRVIIWKLTCILFFFQLTWSRRSHWIFVYCLGVYADYFKMLSFLSWDLLWPVVWVTIDFFYHTFVHVLSLSDLVTIKVTLAYYNWLYSSFHTIDYFFSSLLFAFNMFLFCFR